MHTERGCPWVQTTLPYEPSFEHEIFSHLLDQESILALFILYISNDSVYDHEFGRSYVRQILNG